jgi:phosphoribosylformimino-5-aminoimidazole carboxamide ribotide isomerase
VTLFRPVIDLHQGKVKQIVGGTLTENPDDLKTNFVSDRSAADFARLYRDDGLKGGHVVMLGSGNEKEALSALLAYPGGLQVGGGITPLNAEAYLNAGASHVIVTSWLFDREGHFEESKLQEVVKAVGRERLVIDVSCCRTDAGWTVVMNRWQSRTDLEITPQTLDHFAGACDELLIHGTDVEGLGRGIDEDLVRLLGSWGRLPLTYAGGAQSIDDLARVQSLSNGKVDLGIGSALDIFGGEKIRYTDCVAYNRDRSTGM